MNFVSGGRMTKLYIVKAEINESAVQEGQSQALSHHSLQLSSIAGAELSTCHCPTHQVTAALRFEKRDCRCLGKTIMPNTKHHRHKDERLAVRRSAEGWTVSVATLRCLYQRARQT